MPEYENNKSNIDGQQLNVHAKQNTKRIKQFMFQTDRISQNNNIKNTETHTNTHQRHPPDIALEKTRDR